MCLRSLFIASNRKKKFIFIQWKNVKRWQQWCKCFLLYKFIGILLWHCYYNLSINMEYKLVLVLLVARSDLNFTFYGNIRITVECLNELKIIIVHNSYLVCIANHLKVLNELICILCTQQLIRHYAVDLVYCYYLMHFSPIQLPGKQKNITIWSETTIKMRFFRFILSHIDRYRILRKVIDIHQMILLNSAVGKFRLFN